MGSFFIHVTEQYEAVRSSRQALFDYCKTISQVDLVTTNSLFGRVGSIRNLLVHIANVYEFWIARNALNKDILFTNYDSKDDMNDIIDLFENINMVMVEFLESFKSPEIKQIEYEINGEQNTTSKLKLFTHVITHEFHHKGQILSLSRSLGYTPVDTDIIR